MTLDNISFRQLPTGTPAEHEPLSLLSLSADRIKQFPSRNDSRESDNQTADPLQAARDGAFFCGAPSDNPHAATDQRIRDTFGADVFDHLRDWNWLIANQQRLRDGLRHATDGDAWDMARRMRDLSTVDGRPLIYLFRHDGPTHGSLVPKRHDLMLRRGGILSDDHLGQFYR
jgi:hypothetical protein